MRICIVENCTGQSPEKVGQGIVRGGMMDNQIENSMIKRPIVLNYREWPYDSPCRTEAPSFREWILETFFLDELIDYAEIKLAAIQRLGPRYQAEMKEEGYEEIEEIS